MTNMTITTTKTNGTGGARKRSSASPARRKQSGIALVSWLLAGVLGAVALGSLFVVYQDQSSKEVMDSAVSDTRRIMANAQKNYGMQNLYGNITTANAVQTGLIPPDLRDAGANTARNKFNGAITLAPVLCSIANDCLGVTNAGVPRAKCADFVLSLAQASRRVQVGGVDVKPVDGVINVGTLATRCDAAATTTVRTDAGRFGAAS